MTAPSPAAARRRWASLAARLLLSVVVLAWLFSRAPIEGVWRAMTRASPSWLCAALALHGVGVWLSAVRWRLLLESSGARVTTGRLAASYLVGFFFNTWLPSGFGGDAVRAWDTRRDTAGAARSFGVIVIERGSGILALFWLGALASVAAGWQRRVPALVALLWIVALMGSLALVVLGWRGVALSRWLAARLGERWVSRRAVRAALDALETSAALGADHAVLAKVMALGVLLQLNVVLHYAWIGRALGVPAPGSYYFLVVPVLIAVLMLPISINGIGTRELVFVRLLGDVGVPEPQALALSLLALALALVFSLVGGLVFAFRGTSGRLDSPQHAP